ncbi:MAG: helix-turn-helix domain-containing protein [Ignavibacteriae bacterium]|nr:helix-turn-helix domain-containing protein [Ignavibacteriota bacterium]
MPNGEYKNLSNKLRTYRIECGYKREYVAKVLGFRDTTKISRWETGDCLPTLVNAFKLASLYGRLSDQLFEDLFLTIKRQIIKRKEELERLEKSETK